MEEQSESTQLENVNGTDSSENQPEQVLSGDQISEQNLKSISVSFAKAQPQVAQKPTQSEITVKQFLDLLKTAYQVHDNLESLLLNKGMTDVVNWIKLKGLSPSQKNKEDGLQDDKAEECSNPVELVKKLSDDVNLMKCMSDLESPLQERLTHVINEGIMDSVLPLMVPTQGPEAKARKPVQKSVSLEKINALMKKKTSIQIVKTDSEVEIHVCDEVNGLKKDFVCNQKLLVEQMGYFADVTKEQKLEDIEISVHCDVYIFEWLMSWIKRDNVLPGDEPNLEVSNAVPILVSASFLQMDPLVNECLHFCHKNMNDIVKTTSSLSCMNDAILTRLAAMYTNSEVEAIKDKKDKIQSKLYCKLIQSLCEIESEALRGHYCTMARVYRCKHCQQIINPKYGTQTPCVPSCMSLQFDGSIKNKHQMDPRWDINEYILGLYKSLKSWRKVYWRLWGVCHCLYCVACKRYFPAWQVGWCRFHPDLPQFFSMDTQKPPLPIGRYPCCGEKAYRFQLLDDRSGCHFRDHTISTTDIRDAAIASLLENMKHLVTDDPPKLVFPDRLTRLIPRKTSTPDDSKLEGRESFWWDGLEIVPPRPKLGVISELAPHTHSDDELDQDEDESDDDDSTRSDSTSITSSSADSEESVPPKNKKKKKPKGKLQGIRQWQLNLSSRSNQDIQRLQEEDSFRNMCAILNDKTKLTAEIEGNKNSKAQKPGGIWVRLESEWREKNMPAVSKSRNVYSGKVRMKTNRLI